MAKVIVGMTVSLDGFVADRNGSAGRLYPDLEDLQGSPYMNAAIERTGAVLMGKLSFEMGDPGRRAGQGRCRRQGRPGHRGSYGMHAATGRRLGR